jgi:hypothetical protein
MDSEDSAPSLLELPDPCVLALMQCCAADDLRSFFSAARAHSRLHQAAKVALTSITFTVRNQRQADKLIVYLHQHGQHVAHVDLTGSESLSVDFWELTVNLRQFPPGVPLISLQLNSLQLQLQSGRGCQGVFGATSWSSLKKLGFKDCTLLDDAPAKALVKSLWQLPAGLEHLSLDYFGLDQLGAFNVPTRCGADVLQHLQKLTHLELGCVQLQGPAYALTSLQPLTRLVDLRLDDVRVATSV